MPVSFHSQKKIAQDSQGESQNFDAKEYENEIKTDLEIQAKIQVNTTTLSGNLSNKLSQTSQQKNLDTSQNSQTNPKFQTKNSSEPNAVHHVKFHLSKIVDKGIYVIAALGPLSAFDQVWQIWAIGNTHGVSLLMWVSWIPGAIFWLTYGILHRDKPIILTQSLWLIMQLAIVTGLLFKR